MSYIIKKQKFYSLSDKIMETCKLNNYAMPVLLRDYETLTKDDFKNEDLQNDLENFIKTFPEFSEIALNLNTEQEEVVTYNGDKFLSVEAGPAAGKTRVLIEKVNYMVNELGVDPETLLIITFSHKAAEELHKDLPKAICLRAMFKKCISQQSTHSAVVFLKKAARLA